jgi:predicted TIM-barrel fold metal-dependent hydrolase
VVPLQDPEFAVEAIERCAPDRRFVQVLVLAMGELPLGRRAYWPVYAAALRHSLPIGIHAGSSYRHPVTSVGWPITYAEDYASQAEGGGLPGAAHEPDHRGRLPDGSTGRRGWSAAV